MDTDSARDDRIKLTSRRAYSLRRFVSSVKRIQPQETSLRKTIMTISLCLGLASGAQAANEAQDYVGPFTTQLLYSLCSRNTSTSRNTCYAYIQGLMYGLNTERSMQEKGMPVCLPEMSLETARLNILKFIDGTTGGRPGNNKDGGDWMAFLGLATGNICKK
jgi:hypothetical protein